MPPLGNLPPANGASVISDPDIFRAAKLLIDQHGKDAAIRAAQRADVLLDEGDVDGAVVWRRIRRTRASKAIDLPPCSIECRQICRRTA